MSDPEQPGQTEPDDESGELVDEPQDDAQEPGGAVVRMPKVDPFAGLDVGNIMPSIDFSKYLPKIDFSVYAPKLNPVIFDAIAKLDFGTKPIIDAAVLKSLANVKMPEFTIPSKLYEQFAAYKFPELKLHSDTLRAIQGIIVQPPRSRGIRPLTVEPLEPDEIIDDEPGTELDPSDGLLQHAERQTAALERVIELLAQSMSDTADAKAETETANSRADRANNLSTWIGVVGLLIAVVAIIVSVLTVG